MKDIPIIFSAPMVRALLAGRKTMTRRLAWRSETDTKKMAFICDGEKVLPRSRLAKGFGVQMAGAYWLRPTPWVHADPGDRLWVRENGAYACRTAPIYQADGEQGGWKWAPSIHMPRWASRLALVVTAVKIERLQDIDEADARAEGVEPAIAGVDKDGGPLHTYRTGFVHIWRELHGDGAWAANPEVVALTFSVHKTNIEKMPRSVAA